MALPFIDTSASPSVLLSVTCEKPPLRGQAPPLTPGRQPFPPPAKKIPEKMPISWSPLFQESDSPREVSLWHAFLPARRITRGVCYLWRIATSEIGGTKKLTHSHTYI